MLAEEEELKKEKRKGGAEEDLEWNTKEMRKNSGTEE